MVSRVKAVLALAAIGATLGAVAGCGGSSADEAQTPAGAETVVNSAPQTDSQGKTVPAPGAATATTATGEQGGGGGGDVAAGKATFAETCTGCHPSDGQQAGVGPKLAGAGFTETRIHDQIVNGGGGMPPGLVSGQDLTNVVAYVVSIQ